jgi:phosphatidate cytidylyltransferase
MIICLKEFYRLTEKSGNSPKKWFAILTSIVIFFIFYYEQIHTLKVVYIYLIVSIAFISFAIELFRDGNSIKNLSAEFLGVLYITIPFATVNYIVFYTGKFDYKLLLSIFIIIWSYDIFAFFIGSSLGKRKIFPKISPNKTLEGTIGGLLTSIIAGILVYKIFNFFSIFDWVILSMLISGGAFIGDLVESKLKRSVGVKDSGKIMPGHGGLLDRFDSFLFAVVAAAFYLMILNNFFN